MTFTLKAESKLGCNQHFHHLPFEPHFNNLMPRDHPTSPSELFQQDNHNNPLLPLPVVIELLPALCSKNLSLFPSSFPVLSPCLTSSLPELSQESVNTEHRSVVYPTLKGRRLRVSPVSCAALLGGWPIGNER